MQKWSRYRLAHVIHEMQVYQNELRVQTEQLEESRRLLQEAHDRYRDLYDLSPIPYMTLCENGVVREVNLTAITLLGMPRDNLIGVPFLFRLAEADRAIFMNHLLRCRRGTTPMRSEMIIKAAGGKRVPIELTSSPGERDAGGHRRILSALVDLSERRAAQEQKAHLQQVIESERLLKEAKDVAENASRVKDEFLATVSHELRTPVSSILLWAHLLRSGAVKQSDRDAALETIYHSAKSQSQIIDDLLDLSRIMTGKFRLDPRPTGLGPLVEGALASLQPAAHAKGIKIHVDIAADAPSLNLDPDRIQQVIWNLLNNSIKFTPEEGNVGVEVRGGKNVATIVVWDSGQGIQKEFLPHVFERFWQKESGTTRTAGGLGLGLSIVKQLVELHGGRVWAQSEGEGKGACFTVELPVRTAEPGSEAGPQEDAGNGKAPNDPSLEGLHVLLVEDDTVTRRALTHLLRRAGATVMVAGDVGTALKALQRRWPDVLVSDIAMPREDGYALIRRIRQMEEHMVGGEQDARPAALPAIALTALASVKDRITALQAGFQVHIAKPFDPGALLETVARMARSRNGNGVGKGAAEELKAVSSTSHFHVSTPP